MLKVRDGAQTTHDETGFMFAGAVYRKSLESGDFDIFPALVANGAAQHFQAIFKAEHRHLAGIDADGSDNTTEQAGRLTQNIQMAGSQRIKCAGVNGGARRAYHRRNRSGELKIPESVHQLPRLPVDTEHAANLLPSDRFRSTD